MQQLDNSRIPAHIAIIMDGNGRWAKAKGLPRTAGHVEGVATVKKITEEATRLGVQYLTLYTFSTENWNRPVEEIEALMHLVLTNLEEEIFMKNNVRFRMIGEMDRLPAGVRKRVQECMERTAGNTRMTVITALSYSSRWEITQTMKEMARKCSAAAGGCQGSAKALYEATGTTLTAIGVITTDKQVSWLENGVPSEIEMKGFTHF